MARIKSGTLVSALTAAAVAAVGVLAVQADGAPAEQPAGALTSASTAHRPSGGRSAPYALPAGSGNGERVVYRLSRHRVWLVDDADNVVHTYRVVPGTIGPDPGSHRVFARAAHGVGGDHRKVEHIVLFATSHGSNVGFSAASDGSLDAPDPAKRTTAIRESRKDGSALWQVATIGSTVEVVK